MVRFPIFSFVEADPVILLQRLAALMMDEPCVESLRLDPVREEVKLSYRPDCQEVEAFQEQLQCILETEVDGATDLAQWQEALAQCQLENLLPPAIALQGVERDGQWHVSLQKASCPTAPRFWKQKALRYVPRYYGAKDEGERRWPRFNPLIWPVLCGIGTVLGLLAEHGQILPTSSALFFYLLAYFAGGWDAARDVWRLLRKGVLDIHFLMLAVAAGAAIIGHYWEGAILLFLFSLSGALEEMAQARTEREIKALFKASPKQANVLDESGEERSVPVEELAPKMRIRIRPGDVFPVDGVIIEGKTAVDEANLTGESIPVEKNRGDSVLSGTLNLWGRVDCEVQRSVQESALQKIIELIRQAQEAKAPSQRFTDRFGSGYTYSILGFSGAMFLVWWLALQLPPVDAFYRTMTLLVVASPCALVISIPSAILSGIAAGARRGVLFRGGASLENLAEIDRVALDKTGTITQGELVVEKMEVMEGSQSDDMLRIAGALGDHSTHPISQAVARAVKQRGLDLPAVEEFVSTTGEGVAGKVQWHGTDLPARMGKRSFAFPAEENINWPIPPEGMTEIALYAPPWKGRFLLQDEVRSASAPLLAQLKSHGLQVAMLTGDREAAARRVARQVGLEEVCFELTPGEKVKRLQGWESEGSRVAMIGDGVNDAPSLAAAHVGVAMGVRGSDAALEQADVVLMRDKLESFIDAYRVSRKTKRITRQNVFFSLGVIVVLVCLALFGNLALPLGVFGHEGSTVVVVLNSLRILWNR